MFLIFSLVSCQNGENSQSTNINSSSENTLVDGPGSPMLRYTGSIEDACEHAKYYHFKSFYMINNSEEILSKIGYRADITEMMFYVDFKIKISDSMVTVRIKSINSDEDFFDATTYNIQTDFYNKLITINNNSRICSEILFKDVPEYVNESVLFEFVRKNIGVCTLC